MPASQQLGPSKISLTRECPACTMQAACAMWIMRNLQCMTPKVEPVLITYLTRRLLGFKSPCTALSSKQLCNNLSASMATSCRASQLPVKRSRRIQPSVGSRSHLDHLHPTWVFFYRCCQLWRQAKVTEFFMQLPWVLRCYHLCHPALPVFRGDKVHMLTSCKLPDVMAAEQAHRQVEACLEMVPTKSRG